MIYIKNFIFNAFSVNTLVLYDETKECILVDPGCSTIEEKKQLLTFLAENKLKPVRLINTHYHIDHIIGNGIIKETYRLVPEANHKGEVFWGNKKMWRSVFKISENDIIPAEKFIKENDIIRFGNSELQVLETPGHADGSICLYSKQDGFVIVGDVLFLQSIGRTDLPTGDFEILKSSIITKLFSLPNAIKVIPGHGPYTEIGFEKANNPFLN